MRKTTHLSDEPFFPRQETLYTPECRVFVDRGVQRLYMGVYKLCTPGWRRNLLTCKINRRSMPIKTLIYKS